MSHEDLKEEALDAINALFGDTSVSQRTSLEDMEELLSDIEMKISALKEDMGRE